MKNIKVPIQFESTLVEVDSSLKLCVNCKHRQYDELEESTYCGNDDSFYFACYVEGEHSCSNFERKYPLKGRMLSVEPR